MVNLLNNAAKYSERGGQIGLTADHQGHAVVLRVTDTGIGIAPDMLPRIFELYAQEGRSADRTAAWGSA